MMKPTSTKEEMWRQIENISPGIKHIFDSYVLGLRLLNFNESLVDITFGKNNHDEPLIRCHIYKSDSQKIFTLYCNKNTGEMFARNQLNEQNRLRTSSPVKIQINSIDELKELLQKLVTI